MPISALVAESFFGSLKNERYHRFTLKTRGEARMSVIWHIESFYNRMRPHSSVGWMRPAELMGSSLKPAAGHLVLSMRLE